MSLDTKTFIAALTVGFIFTVIGHPLWLSCGNLLPSGNWVFWGLGVGLVAVGAGMIGFEVYEGIGALLLSIGGMWAIIWFFSVFPIFGYALI
jgi:hypothetical protein